MNFISFVFFFTFVSFVDASKLRFVQAIWRHGDRAPGSLPYPLDLNNETVWPNGWENLTEIGVKQLNELGRFFRSRYGHNFLGKEYDTNEISLQSSKSQRALDSSEAFLQGFCQSNDDSSSSSSESSYCPTVSLPTIKTTNGDPLLKPTSYDCPFYDQKSKQENGQLFEELTQKYKDLFEFLGNQTGQGPNITLHKVARLNDLNREIIHGLKQPDWLYKKWPQYDNNSTLELVTELYRIERMNSFNKFDLARLRGGFLLADWLQRAINVSNGKQTNPSKMMLYSSHDGTLQSILYALKIADDKEVPYAACVIMEVYEHDKGGFYVKFYYKHDGQLDKKEIPNCNKKCDLNDFVKMYNSTAIYSIETLDKECEINGTITPQILAVK